MYGLLEVSVAWHIHVKQRIWVNMIYFSSADQESTVLPATWDDMQNQRLKIVKLKPETREYRDVQEKFLKTCQSFRIEKVKTCQHS